MNLKPRPWVRGLVHGSVALLAIFGLISGYNAWKNYDKHQLRPFFHATKDIGQGHEDNLSTAEHNVWPEKTEKALIKTILFELDALSAENLGDTNKINYLVGMLDNKTDNFLRIRAAVERAKAALLEPLSEQRKKTETKMEAVKNDTARLIDTLMRQPAAADTEFYVRYQQALDEGYTLLWSGSLDAGQSHSENFADRHKSRIIFDKPVTYKKNSDSGHADLADSRHIGPTEPIKITALSNKTAVAFFAK